MDTMWVSILTKELSVSNYDDIDRCVKLHLQGLFSYIHL